MREKLNSAGFSLLEVVLAMAILAIVSIPLLSYFSNSMKYNAKMASKQHATVLAQDVIEDLKNEDVLVEKKDDGTYAAQYLLDQGYTESTSTLAVTGDGTFYKTEGAYDIAVQVKTGNAENADAQPVLSGINDKTDVLAVESGQLQEALLKIRAMHAAYAESSEGVAVWSEQEIKEEMQRTIHIKITKTAAGYHVKVYADYTAGNVSQNIPGIDPDEIWETSAYADTDVQSVGAVYLLYSAEKEQESVQVEGVGGLVKPEYHIICQNTDTVFTGVYKLALTADYAINGSSIYTNIGQYANGWQITNGATAYSDTNRLAADETGVRKTDLTVSVYKKGDYAASADPYLTVSASKGEQP